MTSLSLDENTKMLRQQNLDNVFGKGVFTKLVCLDTGADKDEGLEPYKDSGLWWIEDKTVNAECGLKFGMKPPLISHNHNIDCDNPRLKKCDYWTDVVDTIPNRERTPNPNRLQIPDSRILVTAGCLSTSIISNLLIAMCLSFSCS